MRQFADWCVEDYDGYNTKWLASYRKAVEAANQIKSGTKLPTDEDIRWLWVDVENGVSSVAPAVISGEQFQAHKDWLRQMTLKIAEAPDHSTYERVRREWMKDGRFPRVLWSVIHRVFAAFAPDLYTTVLNTQMCRPLLTKLRTQFELDRPSSDNWISLNQSIKDCMASAGLDEARLLENNIALWRVAEGKTAQTSLTGGATALTTNGGIPASLGESFVKNANVPLNQILFGPPGTGKTHHAITKALEILAPDMASEEVSRDQQVAAFNRFRENGQVVFCTFHQSFSYEDFVEGLRAETKDGQISYEVADGVFKDFCTRAATGLTADRDVLTSALERFNKAIESAPGEAVTLTTQRGNRFAVSLLNATSYRVMPEASRKPDREPDTVYRAFFKDLQKFHETRDPREVHNPSYVRGIVEHLEQEHGLPAYVQPIDTQRPRFVMIIDEINRGNVSRIFGELITLIEASKRKGAEGLEVMLPYSKKRFSVPDNVYLIGTMNTADKSLATVDIALRRRFHFTEMPPRPDLLDGINVGEVNIGRLLRTLNERIEVLLDRDHCIGHASFMPLKGGCTLSALHAIFERQILPLLQEYFFEDWQRIAWVLNDHRKQPTHRFLLQPATDRDVLFGPDVTLPHRNVRWSINTPAFALEQSYLGVIGVAPQTAVETAG